MEVISFRHGAENSTRRRKFVCTQAHGKIDEKYFSNANFQREHVRQCKVDNAKHFSVLPFLNLFINSYLSAGKYVFRTR